MLASEGDAFIQSNHYAVDSIIPKCSELHHLCDAFTTEMEQKRNVLNKSLELHGLLEKVNFLFCFLSCILKPPATQ